MIGWKAMVEGGSLPSLLIDLSSRSERRLDLEESELECYSKR